MKTHTIESMKEALEPKDFLSSYELEARNIILLDYKYSVIVEGQYTEFDSLDRWIKHNIERDTILDIWLCKTGYDYGFAEFYLKERTSEEKLRFIIPNMYFEYRSFFTNEEGVSRSDGYGNYIELDPNDNNAIIYPSNGNFWIPSKGPFD